MNRWAANNPELFDELGGNEGMAEYLRAGADRARKERREQEPMCRVCSEQPMTDNLRGTCRRCADSLEDERTRGY
jgi:hypothetical protein